MRTAYEMNPFAAPLPSGVSGALSERVFGALRTGRSLQNALNYEFFDEQPSAEEVPKEIAELQQQPWDHFHSKGEGTSNTGSERERGFFFFFFFPHCSYPSFKENGAWLDGLTRLRSLVLPDFNLQSCQVVFSSLTRLQRLELTDLVLFPMDLVRFSKLGNLICLRVSKFESRVELRRQAAIHLPNTHIREEIVQNT